MVNRPPAKAMLTRCRRWSRPCLLLSIACARPTSRIRHVVRFGPDKPLRLDAGVDLVAVPDRLPDLRHAQRRAHQRGADLPRAHRRPARRQRPSGHRQARLVGDHGRARPADRHRALFRDLPERDRRLHGHDRPGLDQSGDRRALGPRFPGHHHPRHGARAGDAARSSRHRHAVLRSPAARWAACRCCNGRRAIRSACSRRCRSRPRRATRRRTSPSTRSAARRSWPIRNGAGGRYLAEGTRPAQGPRGRAHGRAHHLSLGRGAAPQVRPPLPGSRQPDLLVRRRFPGRELSAPPGHLVRRALRRQFLSLPHARDGLFRSRGGLRRRARQCLQGHARRASA